MDLKKEAKRLLKEAMEDFERASRNSDFQDRVTVVYYSQLAIEKSAKAVISCCESFQWIHDPSEQLTRLIRKSIERQRTIMMREKRSLNLKICH